MRYRVLDLPVKGVGAFTPLATTNPIASSWGLVHLTGSPGTLPIPVPGPTRVWAPTPNNAPLVQSSNCSPDIWLPDEYVPSAMNMGPDQHFGMAARRHTPLPVPAVSWIAVVRRAMTGRKVGGRTVVDNPRAFQRFPQRQGAV